MKKRRLFLPVIAAAVCVIAFSHGPTSAFFIDRDTRDGAETGAGYLDVSIDASLSGYGVPGDILKLGEVRIANKGSADMAYKLCLTADADTAELLDTDRGAIILTDNGKPLDTELLSNAQNGTITLLYCGELTDSVQALDIELAFKGVTLVDGNDYQNKPFSITHEVIAAQAGTGIVDRVNSPVGGGE